MITNEILKRRSIRTYRSDTVSNVDLEEIIKAAQFAPTSKGNHAVEFIVVKDQDIKNKIFDIVGQDYVKASPVLIVPAIDSDKSELPVQDLTLATAHIFLEATALGLGTVWKNLNPFWVKEVKKILEIPDNIEIINFIPVGYPKDTLPAHADSEYSKEKIHHEKW